MVEGLWTVQFQGVAGSGSGIAVFSNGKVLGGDTGYTYVGTYESADGNDIKARVKVSNFVPGIPNAMGRQGDFDLEFSGTVTGDTMNVIANMVGAPANRLNARLNRRANLS